MLSILIPCYNYNAVALVKELHKQALNCKITFEILVYDDASSTYLNTNNTTINKLNFCIFKALPKNIGRSKIRNLLGKAATFENLLFIDVGTFPESKFFIKNYCSKLNNAVVTGGMIEKKIAPKKPYKLRWIYTKKRERQTLCSSNFLISKTVLKNHPFDETLIDYGYEDVLFFNTLKRKFKTLITINNPVIHDSEDTASAFILKVELSLHNLCKLITEKKLTKADSKIYYGFLILRKYKLVALYKFIFKLTKPLVLRNFNSSTPSLLLFDMYRLGYICTIKPKL